MDAELRSLRRAEGERAGATLARIEAQANAKAVQLRGLEMELSTLDTTLAKRREGRRRGAASSWQKLIGLVQPDGEGAHHLEARQADLHKQVVAGQNRMFEAERRTLETEADVRKWDTEIENMRQRMTEDGLVMSADGSVRPEKGGALDVEVPTWMHGGGGRAGGLRPMSGRRDHRPRRAGQGDRAAARAVCGRSAR